MSAITKLKSNSKNKKTFAVVDSKVGNYENDPFFVKKANASKTLLKAVGLPRQLTKAK